MAAPHVAGSVALYKLENPDATHQEIMNMVLDSSSTQIQYAMEDLRVISQETLIP